MKTLMSIWNEIKVIVALLFLTLTQLYMRAKKWLLALIAAIFTISCTSYTYFPYHGGRAIEVYGSEQDNARFASDSCNGHYTTIAETNTSLLFTCGHSTDDTSRFSVQSHER
jgi:hypothetical protein